MYPWGTWRGQGSYQPGTMWPLLTKISLSLCLQVISKEQDMV